MRVAVERVKRLASSCSVLKRQMHKNAKCADRTQHQSLFDYLIVKLRNYDGKKQIKQQNRVIVLLADNYPSIIKLLLRQQSIDSTKSFNNFNARRLRNLDVKVKEKRHKTQVSSCSLLKSTLICLRFKHQR